MMVKADDIVQPEQHYKRLYTVDDFDRFLTMPTNQNRLYELIHGEVVEKVPTEEHGIIALNIGAAVRVYVKAHKLGRVGVEIRHRKPGDRYNDRMPDVSFRADVDNEVVKRGSVPQMPDLAVEVKSPNDNDVELREKAEYYLQNGTRLVWLICPENRIVEVCTASSEEPGAIYIKVETVELDGGEVLPGFTLPVTEIFELS